MDKNTYYSELGYQIRRARLFKDIKSKDLAKAMNVSPSYISEIEHGKKVITCWRLYRIKEFIRNYSDC